MYYFTDHSQSDLLSSLCTPLFLSAHRLLYIAKGEMSGCGHHAHAQSVYAMETAMCTEILACSVALAHTLCTRYGDCDVCAKKMMMCTECVRVHQRQINTSNTI